MGNSPHLYAKVPVKHDLFNLLAQEVPNSVSLSSESINWALGHLIKHLDPLDRDGQD